MSKKGMVPHKAYTEVLPCRKTQWPVEYQRKKEEERYQEQRHNMRTTCVFSTTKQKTEIKLGT